MTWSDLLRKEWGAVTFVLTVFVGVVAVPLAFYAFHEGPQPVTLPTATPTVASAASSSR